MPSIKDGAELYQQRAGARASARAGDGQDPQTRQTQQQANGLARGRALYLARGDTAARDRLVAWETAPETTDNLVFGDDTA